MRLNPLALVLALACLVAAGPASAEPNGFHISLSPFAGYTFMDKELVPELDDAVHFGGRIGIMMNQYIGVEGSYHHTDSNFALDTDDDFNLQTYSVDLLIHLLPFAPINPYVTGGWAQINGDPAGDEDWAQYNGWEFGGGAKIALWRGSGTRGSIRLDARDVIAKWDDFAGSAGNDTRHTIFVSGGFTLDLGPNSEKDTDGDGVLDDADQCPDTPLGAVVDMNGCPKDNDGDGVPDGLDACPNTPAGARVDAQGCPTDGDSDGVPDGIDQCSNTPAGAQVDATGCPLDADGDGVPDGIDQCPTTPAGAVVDATGCPLDGDGDGVPDGIDQCPSTPAGARVDVQGCEISEEEAVLLDTGTLVLKGVTFETGSDRLASSSFETLDGAGALLIKWPQLKVEVGGHTDNTGAASFNQQLSEKRAQSVMNYLNQNFPAIQVGQLTAVGYGEDRPIASNDTNEGRSQNRRVELKVLNRGEVLKQ